MKLSAANKEILLKEFEIVMPKLEKTIDLGNKLYYFSALHGMVRHLMNIQYDDSLIYLHHVLQTTHTTFANRLNAMKNNIEFPINITDQMINKLISLVKELYNCLDQDTDYKPTLESMVILAYTTTGNGFYLYDKGVLKI